jgi:hypothetical protein
MQALRAPLDFTDVFRILAETRPFYCAFDVSSRSALFMSVASKAGSTVLE